MNKKTYSSPIIRVYITGLSRVICNRQLTNTDGNADLILGGGGSGPARAPRYVWNDWEE